MNPVTVYMQENKLYINTEAEKKEREGGQRMAGIDPIFWGWWWSAETGPWVTSDGGGAGG